MKKFISAILIIIVCLSCFAGCSQQESQKTAKDNLAVYSFGGSDEHLTVSNGVIVLGGEEEVFSGGELAVLNSDELSDIASWSTEFYVLTDGEKRTVQKNHIVDVDAGAKVELSGDLGKIAGPDVITEYESSDDDFADNLYFVFSGTDKKGKESVYEIRMDVTRVK